MNTFTFTYTVDRGHQITSKWFTKSTFWLIRAECGLCLNKFPKYFEKLENVELLEVDFSKNDFMNRMKLISSIDVLINNYHSGYIFKHIYRYEATEILNSIKVNTIPVI